MNKQAVEWTRAMAGLETATVNGICYRKAYSGAAKCWRIYRQDSLVSVVSGRTEAQARKNFLKFLTGEAQQ